MIMLVIGHWISFDGGSATYAFGLGVEEEDNQEGKSHTAGEEDPCPAVHRVVHW